MQLYQRMGPTCEVVQQSALLFEIPRFCHFAYSALLYNLAVSFSSRGEFSEMPLNIVSDNFELITVFTIYYRYSSMFKNQNSRHGSEL